MEATITTEPPLEREENDPLPSRDPRPQTTWGPPHPGSLSFSVPSFLHLWHHCLCHQGCGLHINVQNLKPGEEGEQHEGRAGEGRVMRAQNTFSRICLLGLVEILEMIAGTLQVKKPRPREKEVSLTSVFSERMKLRPG